MLYRRRLLLLVLPQKVKDIVYCGDMINVRTKKMSTFCRPIHQTDSQWVFQVLRIIIGGVVTRFVNLPLTPSNNLMGFFFFSIDNFKVLSGIFKISTKYNTQSFSHHKGTIRPQENTINVSKVWQRWGLACKKVGVLLQK